MRRNPPHPLPAWLLVAAIGWAGSAPAPPARAAELFGGELLLSCAGWDLTEIEPDTGEQKPLGVGSQSALAVDDDGVVWGVENHWLVRVDPRTGDTRAPLAFVHNFDNSDDGELLPEPGGTLLHAYNGAVSRLDPVAGTVTPLAAGAPLVRPMGLAFADGDDVFVADAGAGAIFRMAPDGELTPVASGNLLVGPYQVHVLPDGDLLVVRSGGRPLRVDPATGAQALYSPLAIGATAAAVAPDGAVLVVTQLGPNGRLVRFTDPAQDPAALLLAGNQNTGRALGGMNRVDVAPDGAIVLLGFAWEPGNTAQVRSILALGPGPAPLRFVSAEPPQGGIAPGRDGSLYIASTSGLRRVDPRTGARETVAQGGSIPRPTDAVVEVDGHVVVINNADGGGPRGVVRVDPESGAQTVLAEDDLFTLPRRIARGADGGIYVASGNDRILRVDPTTGAQTAASSEGILELVYDVAAEASGTLLALDIDLSHDRLLRIDPENGAQTPVGPPIWSTTPQYGPNQSSDFAITPDGTPYVILLGSFGRYRLYRAALDAAELELVSELPLCAGSELEAVLAPEPRAALAAAAAGLALAGRAARQRRREPARSR